MSEISKALKKLLETVDELRKAYPKKRFTLDGRLVGDIGEILVEGAYDLTLFDVLAKHHDGKTSDGRLVQIKATMQGSLTFPGDHVPDNYLGIKINSDGTFVEIFNGPGDIIARFLNNRKATKTNLHSVSISSLARLNADVPENKKIPLKATSRGAKRGQ